MYATFHVRFPRPLHFLILKRSLVCMLIRFSFHHYDGKITVVT